MVSVMADSKPKKKNLNVSLEDGERIAKVAAIRNKTIEDLFRDRDVQDFFRHLLVEEMRKEAERQKPRK